MIGRALLKIFVAFAVVLPAYSLQNINDDVRPSQHHTAFHGPFGMTVSWSTHARLDKPTVHYGLTPYTLWQQASSSESVTYPTSTTYLNHVILKDLLPYTTYYYSVSNSFTNQTYHFKTARIEGDRSSHTVAMVADMGTFGSLGLSFNEKYPPALAPGEITTIQRLSTTLDQFDFLLHPGDFAYSDYWLKEELLGYLPFNLSTGPQVYEQINEEFYTQLENITAIKPYMVSVGNHEANCDNGGTKGYTESICPIGQTNFTGYINRFRMPSDVSKGVGNFWYSYNYGMVHYLHYTTETDFPGAPDAFGGGQGDNEGPFAPTGAQLAWIEQDLKSVNRAITPWVVALGHRPWYVASSLCYTCQAAFEPLFNEYNVDIVLSGHVHAMERNAPIAKNITDPNGLNNPKAPLYLTNGAAGHFEGLDPLNKPLPNYVTYANNTKFGYSLLTFHNTTHMTHNFISSASGQVLDSATLYKERSFPF